MRTAPHFEVSGIAIDEFARPVSGAIVALDADWPLFGGPKGSSETDADGGFRIGLLRPGDYRLTVTPPGTKPTPSTGWTPFVRVRLGEHDVVGLGDSGPDSVIRSTPTTWRGCVVKSRSLWTSGMAAVACALAVLASAQTLTPVFEAASIKPNPARTGIRGHSFPGDRFVAINVPLLELILVGYGQPGQLLPYVRVSGGPDWMNSDRYDVNATVGSRAQKSVAHKQLMLRTLLVERFRLAVTRKHGTFRFTRSRVRRRMGRWDHGYVVPVWTASRCWHQNRVDEIAASCMRCRLAR